MAHYDGRYSSACGAVHAVDIASADAAGLYLHENFARTNLRFRNIAVFQGAVLSQNQSLHARPLRIAFI